MSTESGVRFEGTSFWVRHRNREFGPFDYEWSRDLRGIEFMYGRRKFGEFCSEDELCADLKEFALPMRVVEVTSIVCGTIVYGIVNGLSQTERRQFLLRHLKQHELPRFADNIEGWPAA